MFLSEMFRILLGLFVAMFLGACAGGRIQHVPQQVSTIQSSDATVVLPDAQSWEGCLTEAAASVQDSDVYPALVIYCSERSFDAPVNDKRIGSALKSLARLAYDPEKNKFSNKRLSENVGVVVALDTDATYRFTDDSDSDVGIGGTELMKRPFVPLIKRVQRTADGMGRFYPPEGLFEPVLLTATTRRSPGDRLTITLAPMAYRDKIAESESAVAEQAYLSLLEAAELDKASWAGFVNPQHMTSHSDGIYLIERYDPNRTPILMIHGLRSNPLTWERLTRAVLSTPDLHQRFQVWHAFYPTGLPPFYTGSRIRAVLNEVLLHFDPEGDDVPTHQMAVIGHSMGGVISHMLVSDDDGALWQATFRVNPSELRVNEYRRAEMIEIFSIRHETQIGFVAFIAAPHRGSETANSLIGRVGSSMVNLPVRFRSIFRQDEAYLAQATEAMRPYLRGGGPDSIRVLSPDHPLLKVLAEIPVASGVAHISVIGVRQGPDCVREPKCKATDGVVAYESSRFSPPEDELIVKAGHNVHHHPEAISFILNRLREWRPEGNALRKK
jgi:pimeloyl-ACP methyl ester carboxylesterase